MAALDISRSAVTLSDDELDIASILIAEPSNPILDTSEGQAVIQSLTEAGLVEDGSLGRLFSEYLEVLVWPKLRLIAEKFVGESIVVDFAWATERAGVLGISVEQGLTELSPIEPALLPWAISRSVGLGSRPTPKVDTPLFLRSSVLDATFGQMANGDRAAAAATLSAESGLDARAQNALLDLLLDRKVSWRATSAWTDIDLGPQVSFVAVVDGGPSGLWLSDQEEGGDGEPVVRLTPVMPSVVWNRIVELMPTQTSSS